MTRRNRILVLCTGNRARSQMAEGYLRHLGGDRLEVHSAGTKPKGLHPVAVKVMAEDGIDISRQTSKHVDQFARQPFDVVVTVCDSAREACPVFPNAEKLVHRSFEDPDTPGSPEEVERKFREVRDRIKVWAQAFLADL